MKNLPVVLGLCSLFLIVSAANCFAQQPAPTPAPQRTPDQREVMRRQIENQERVNREFAALRNVSERGNNSRVNSSPALINNITSLYRKTNKRERQLLAPDAGDLARFAAFLQQPETGLIKLAADKGCAENPNIVVATADCLAYAMPGAGGSYSFRVKDYRLPRLSDLTFTDDSFQAEGVRLHGIFTDIGDVPLEQINLTNTRGLNYLVNFKPESDFRKAKELDRQLIVGIEKDGFLYRRAVAARENTTYVLRSVAYRGVYYRSMGGITYNELEFDKRKDVIVAFRLVRRHDDGAITILWKLLAVQNSPKTTWSKENQADEKKNTDFTSSGSNKKPN